MTYVVTAPYVTLKVKDLTGQEAVLGFYESGTLPDGANKDDVERLIRKGMVAESGTAEADLAAPAGTPKPGEPPNVPVTEQPIAALPLAERQRLQQEAADKVAADAAKAKEGAAPSARASKDEWVDWAVAQRAEDVSEQDARAEAEAMTKNDLMAKYGG